MKQIGFFLLKNNIHIMTLVFGAWTVWAALNWDDLSLLQRLVMGLYALLIVHEYEEGYKGRFLDIMAGRLLGIDHRALTPGVTHIAQAVYITVAFSAALLFPGQLWLTLAVIVLGLFEGFVHNVGIFLFRLRGVSPGWWTAMLMAAYCIWAIVVIGRNIDYSGIQWLWGVLAFLGCFLCMEAAFQRLIGNRLSDMPKAMRRFLNQRFGR